MCHEGNTVITNDQSEFSSYGTQRNSIDNELNNHRKRLLEICRNTDLRILNGRVRGDSLGRPTFHSKSGVSVIDYAICDQDLFRHIANFPVSQFPNFPAVKSSYSDHSPVITWLNINTVNQNQLHQLLTMHYYIFQNDLFGKMNLHEKLEPHYKQNIYRE